ncbi:MAG: TonB-dependent receptor plug domain-containing protein, partial [Opitutus sp.]
MSVPDKKSMRLIAARTLPLVVSVPRYAAAVPPMRLSRPVYYSCLLSVLIAGAARSAAQPSVPISSPMAQREKRDPCAFRIGAADASLSLEIFSTQAGAPLVYVVEHVRGIRTNGVEGRFRPREALERLVANTALTVVEDERTGALMIKRRTPVAGPPAHSPPETKPDTDPMKSSRSARLAGWLPALLSVLTATADGQTTSSRDGTTPGVAADEAVVLSPFTVNSEKDTGYAASSTLAGTRLNTPIKDLGASISVYNKDFLDDIGATSANDLLIYATGMEAGGPGGNFSNAAGGNITEPSVVGDGVRNNPQGASRARGLTSPTYTRGYFISDVSVDGYNTSSVTVNRGPNAILFGVANAAGVVDTTLLRANLKRNTNKVELRYGNNDSMRGTLDINRVLIPDKLGIRLALLADDERYNQRPSFDNKRRIYGTATFEPTRTTV